MKLLVSVWHVDETYAAVIGGADIVDVKDPSAGSLGAPKPSVILKVKEIISLNNPKCEVSAAIGDIKCCPSTVRLASYALSSIGLDYVKVGIETADFKLAYSIAENAVEGAREGGKAQVIIVAYADFKRINSLNPLTLPEIAYSVNADGVMIDTRIKDGRNTFNHLSLNELKQFVSKAKKYGLITALAGGLNIEHVEAAYKLGFDVIGFRTAVCDGGRLGKLSKDKICTFKNIIKKLEKDR